MKLTVADIIQAMESIAPSFLAEKWDNPGLQVGTKDHPVKTIRVSLDPSRKVVADACKKGVDLLITHHPLIFHPLKSIDFSTPTGSIIKTAINGGLAVFSAHTNLDSAKGGVNDVLASKIGLKRLTVLQEKNESGPWGPEMFKLAIYVPVGHEDQFMEAFFQTGSGKIGEYSCCSFRSRGKGTFLPGESSTPFIGAPGEISQVDEIRMETLVEKKDLPALVAHLKKAHPYETMAYDIYPLALCKTGHGLGRLGELEKESRLDDFARDIGEKLGLSSIKIAGRPDLPIKKVALCAGSGSGMLKQFIMSKADAYVSGDLGHHDALEIVERNLSLIDIGHFSSEFCVVEALAERVNRILNQSGADVGVHACSMEKNPFNQIDL